MLFTSVVLPEILYIVVGTGIVQHAHWTPRSASAAEQPSDVVNVSSIMLELQRAKDNSYTSLADAACESVPSSCPPLSMTQASSPQHPSVVVPQLHQCIMA